MTDRKHNGGPSFDDIVRDSLDRDLWYEVSKSSSRAMQDLRLTRFQLHILGALIDFLNPETGTAFPGRKTLAEKTGYSEGAVANAISALIGFGYVISARRQSQPGARALAHYAITRPSVEEYQAAIEKHLADRGLKSKPGWRPQWEADVTPVDDVRKADVITVSDVMKANVTPVCDVTVADVTPVDDVRTAANVTDGHDISANGTPVGDVRKADVTNGHGQYSKKEESKKEREDTPLPPIGGGRAKSNFWQQALNPQSDHGVELLDGGKLSLRDGTRDEWLSRFGGDATALDLALIETAAQIQPSSTVPLKAQVERKLAQIARIEHGVNKRRAAPAKSFAQQDAEKTRNAWARRNV